MALAGTGAELAHLTPRPVKGLFGDNYLSFAGSGETFAKQFLPEIYEKEVERYGNRTVSGFLSLVGAEMPMASDEVVWSEQGRIHVAYEGVTMLDESAECKISFPKHRYKKFIKDTVSGTIEREEFILEKLKSILSYEFNESRTDLILKIMIMSASFELIFVHKTPIKVIVSEYVKISDFFLENAHKRYLNAILDKVSKNVRNL